MDEKLSKKFEAIAKIVAGFAAISSAIAGIVVLHNNLRSVTNVRILTNVNKTKLAENG